MTTLHIEHPITDFEIWSTAFHQFADARQAAGVRAHSVKRPVDDPHYVFVDLEFDDVDAALAFRHFLTTVVWAVSDNLVGTPKATVLEPASL